MKPIMFLPDEQERNFSTSFVSLMAGFLRKVFEKPGRRAMGPTADRALRGPTEGQRPGLREA
jgi:hypothetical protein